MSAIKRWKMICPSLDSTGTTTLSTGSLTMKSPYSRIGRAGGCYQQKGRNTWRVWLPWRGKKIFINRYTDGSPIYSEQQAFTVLEKIRVEVENGTFELSSWGRDFSIQRAWDVYMEQSPCGKDRMEARERIFKDFILPYFKEGVFRDIDEHHVMEWWSTIPKNYAPSYLKVIRATLRAFLNFHRVTRIKMMKFPVVKVPRKTPEWLSKQEQEKVLSAIPPYHQPVMKFLMTYGCRVSEACNLRKSDVDWEKGIITFRERKNDRDNTLQIFDTMRSILRGSGKVTNLEYIFCTANGEKYTRQVLYRIWTDACKKASVKVIPLKNATRHSLACQLLEKGESASMVSRILGNTASVVEKSYGAISVQAASEVLAKVSGCIG